MIFDFSNHTLAPPISRPRLSCCTRRSVGGLAKIACGYSSSASLPYWLCPRGMYGRCQISQSQESCLYRRLNAALRNHDMRSLAPLLPYMKLLLSALYQLPLTPARTYRGVKLELFQVSPTLIHTTIYWIPACSVAVLFLPQIAHR